MNNSSNTKEIEWKINFLPMPVPLSLVLFPKGLALLPVS